MYTVGIQRWPLPFFKKFRVLAHQTEDMGSFKRLVLHMADGSYLAIPRLDRKKVKVYPDFRIQQQQLEQAKQAEKAKAPIQPEPPAFIPLQE